MSICTYYRGRLSFTEVLNMPIEYIHAFEYMIHTNQIRERELKEAEALEDSIS